MPPVGRCTPCWRCLPTRRRKWRTTARASRRSWKRAPAASTAPRTPEPGPLTTLIRRRCPVPSNATRPARARIPLRFSSRSTPRFAKACGYDGAVSARGTTRTGRVLLAVLVGMVSMGLGWLLWPPSGGGQVRTAKATVVESVLCGPSNAEDLVHVELAGGRVVPARLDGCGHRLGEVLAVEAPYPLPAGEWVVRLAGTGVAPVARDAQRLGAVGVAIAGIAGALLAWRLRGGWTAAHRRVGA